jgi:hypothetical protein
VPVDITASLASPAFPQVVLTKRPVESARPDTVARQRPAISPAANELERRASHNLTIACRSILNRSLEAAGGERLIPRPTRCERSG